MFDVSLATHDFDRPSYLQSPLDVRCVLVGGLLHSVIARETSAG